MVSPELIKWLCIFLTVALEEIAGYDLWSIVKEWYNELPTNVR